MRAKNAVAYLIALGGFAVLSVASGCGAAPGAAGSESSSDEASEQSVVESKQSVKESKGELLASCPAEHSMYSFIPKVCDPWAEQTGCRTCPHAGRCGDMDDPYEERVTTTYLYSRWCWDSRLDRWSGEMEYKRFYPDTCGCNM